MGSVNSRVILGLLAFVQAGAVQAACTPDGLDLRGPAGTQPQINVASIAFLGVAATFPQGRTANNYTFQDTVTWVRGDHTWRGGIDFLRQISTQAAPYNARRS